MNKKYLLICKVFIVVLILSASITLFAACKTETLPEVLTVNEGLVISDNGELTDYVATDTTMFLPDTVTSVKEGLFRGSNITRFYSNKITIISDRMFENCPKLTLINTPSVLEIGDNAFRGCLSLESLAFPLVATVGEMAFFNCNLSSIEMPQAEEIGDQAFAYNTSLVTAKFLKAQNDTFGDAMFTNCVALTSVEIPLVTFIPSNTFSGCSSLVAFDFAKVTGIGSNSFNRTAIQSLSLPNIERIENYAFSFSALESVQLPLVTVLGKSVFLGCTKLNSVDLPLLSVVSSELFKGCTALTSISLPSATVVREKSFQSTSITSFDFTKITEVEADAFNTTKLVTVDAPLLTVVNNSVFQNTSTLTTVKLANVTQINMQSFGNCKSLNSVTIPKLTATGIAAFEECSSLTTIDLPLLNTMGANTFANCTALANTTFANLKRVSVAAFLNCKALATFDFSKINELSASSFEGSGLTLVELSARTVAAKAFANCASLKSISLPTTTELLDSAFAGCSSLTSITAPLLVKTGNFAFSNCSALEAVSLASLTTVGTNVFEHCSKLNSVTLPALTKLNDYIFYYCTNLKVFDFEKIVDNTGSYTRGEFAFASSGMTVANFSKSALTELPFGIFSGCSKLTTATLSSTIKIIGSQAFVGCRVLAEIDLTNVTQLGSRASGSVFSSCIGIKKITVPTTLKKLVGENNFSGWKNTQVILLKFESATITESNWGSNWAQGCDAIVTYGAK